MKRLQLPPAFEVLRDWVRRYKPKGRFASQFAFRRERAFTESGRDREPKFTWYERYLVSLGFFTQSWGTMEAALDLCVMIIRQRYEGDTIYPDPPRSLEQRVEFIKRAHKELPQLSAHSEKGIKLANRIGALRDQRNTLIHGVPCNFSPNLVEIARIVYTKDGHRVTHHLIRHRKVMELAETALAIRADLSRYAMTDLAPGYLTPEELEEFVG